jgi:hypothetical protein
MASVPGFGGNRGGKKRADGLPPGSPQALEADRKKDRERKQAQRVLAEPPPLPSAGPGLANPAPAAPGGEVPGGGPAGPPPVPWEPQLVKEFTDELIEAAEAGRVEKFTGKARNAKIPERVVREIGTDSRFPASIKKSLQISTPRVAAKWLNKAGVSAEYADEVAFIGSLGALFIQGRKLSAKLDKLIELAKQPQPTLGPGPAPAGAPAIAGPPKIQPMHP